MSTPTFEALDLAALSDADFNRLYAEQIEPLLAADEDARKAGVKRFFQGLVIALVLAVVLAGVVLQVAGEWPPAAIAFLIAALLGAAIAYAPLGKLEESVKSKLLGALSRTISAQYVGEGFSPPAFERMRALSLTPSFDRSKFEDLFHGERLGCAYDLYEAHLEDERRDKDGDRSYVTVFRGQLIRIAFPKQFLGVTVVRRDAGVFNALRAVGSEMQRVGLGDARFERIFEVYSTDQMEARYLVHPVFMERLLALETAFKGKAVRCAFQSGELMIALEGGDKFEVGSMFEPLARQERARKVINDIAQVLNVMDAVLTAEQAPLVAKKLLGDRNDAG